MLVRSTFSFTIVDVGHPLFAQRPVSGSGYTYSPESNPELLVRLTEPGQRLIQALLKVPGVTRIAPTEVSSGGYAGYRFDFDIKWTRKTPASIAGRLVAILARY